MEPILSVKDLSVSFNAFAGKVHAVRDVNFDLYKGETLAIVGESGSGKSVTTKAILGILAKNGHIDSGTIMYQGQDMAKYKEADFYKIRGKRISLVFQDPLSALNPIMKIGKQITEALILSKAIEKSKAKARAIELMEAVGIPNAAERYDAYPFQFSGGMRQRIVIAIALASNPEILICDEPTTALDVTIQARILELINDIHHPRSGRGGQHGGPDLRDVCRTHCGSGDLRGYFLSAGPSLYLGAPFGYAGPSHGGDTVCYPRCAAQHAASAQGRCLCGQK